MKRSTPLLLLSDVLHEDPRTFAALISKTGVARYMTDLLASIEVDWMALSRREPEAMRSLALFKSLMSTPLLLLSDVLHEDPRTFAALISKTGVARYMTDLLASIEVDWMALSRREPEAMRSLALFKSLMIALTRLSLTESGWNALAELALPEVLAQLQMLSHPPKQVFLQPTSIKEKDTPGELYVSSFELILHLCIAICAKPKWKRLSFKILDVVHSQGELLNQLMRAEIQCRMVDYATTLVQHIWENDDTTRLVIDGDSMLNQLRARPHGADIPQKCAKKPHSFVIPSRLCPEYAR
ncbi:hypothetical protein ANCCAN_23600 [Ancylostoma caninum]|uniref:Uncharacterized protein n=1 Tax=Ancylostoma caninum TaxID=29170 RepID=A0A368FIA2_ANCCA|nr:hypothetical protein ANCCAN_23600 [Ancylostoma caninum]